MDWKEDLGNYFNSLGIYRLDYLNKELYRWCNEWIDYLKEFDGIHPTFDQKLITLDDINHQPDEFPRPLVFNCYFIKVNKQGDWQPFQTYISYFINDSGKLCLYLKNTETVDPATILKGRPFDREENYDWTLRNKQEIHDDQIFEQGYILQLLNNRLKKYFDSKT